mmetsp:Transcript_16797/g.43653  ORF Transcript_16797/g.43653 Transcript_16797/m.43653 type:complete len:206 (-) Transcript_16797:885-1502(-)
MCSQVCTVDPLASGVTVPRCAEWPATPSTESSQRPATMATSKRGTLQSVSFAGKRVWVRRSCQQSSIVSRVSSPLHVRTTPSLWWTLRDNAWLGPSTATPIASQTSAGAPTVGGSYLPAWTTQFESGTCRQAAPYHGYESRRLPQVWRSHLQRTTWPLPTWISWASTCGSTVQCIRTHRSSRSAWSATTRLKMSPPYHPHEARAL